MKKEYISPEMEIVAISSEYIIVTSLAEGGEGTGGSTGWGESTITNG